MNQNYDGINISRVFCPHPPLEKNRIIRILYNFRNAKNVAKEIIKQNPDIIHSHDLNALFEGAIASRKTNASLIYDAHEAWPLLEYTKSNNSIFVYLATLIYEKLLLTRVSYEIRAVVHQKLLLPEQNSILLLNVPLLNFMDGANGDEIRNKLKLNDKIVIIYHGVVGEKKGIVDLIDAAEILVKKYDNLKFLVVGNGYEPFLELAKKKSIANHFIFTGRAQYSDIPSYLKASDISFTIHRPVKQYLIGTPNKLYESMAAGLPVLGNAEFPGIYAVIKKNNLGVTVNCNRNEIVKGLDKLINDKNLRIQLSKNAKAATEREYNWEHQEIRLINLYKKILQKNPKK
jgi:glycosyltransferase involved in cell wall biosynthesis